MSNDNDGVAGERILDRLPDGDRRDFLKAVGATGAALGLPGAAAAKSQKGTYGEWKSSEIGGGGYLVDVHPTADRNRFYLRGDMGFFRSDDRGQHWELLHDSLPDGGGKNSIRGASVDPRDSDNVVITNGANWLPVYGVQTSTDAGDSWEQTLKLDVRGNGSNRESGNILARNPENPDELLLAPLGRQVWKDPDDFDLDEITVGLYRSTDNGQSWDHLADSPQGTNPTHVAFDPHDPERVLMVADSIDGWHGTDEVFWQFDDDPDGGSDVKAPRSGVFRSTDGGDTWEQLGDNPNELTEFVFDPQEPGRVYAIDGSRVYLSTDLGETWTEHTDGLEFIGGDGFEYNYEAIETGPDFVLLGNGDGYVYRQPAGGDTWEQVFEPDEEHIHADGDWWGDYTDEDDGWEQFGKQMSSLTVDPHDPDHWFWTDWYALWESHDAGNNWELSMNDVETTVCFTVAQDPEKENVVHLGMADNTYFRSHDHGRAFEKVPVPSDRYQLKDIAVSRADPSRVYGLPLNWSLGHVAISEDRGQTWEISEMDGMPWGLPAVTQIAAHPEDPMTVYAALGESPGWVGWWGAHEEGVWRSTDGGQSWEHLADGFPTGGDAFFPHNFWNTSDGQLGASGDGSLIAASWPTREVYRFDPDAEQWHDTGLDLDGAPSVAAADPFQPGRYLLTVGGDGVYETTDAGASWAKVLDADANYLAFDQAVEGRLALDVHGATLLSEDGGETWTELDDGLPLRVSTPLAFSGDRLLAATKGNGVFWTRI